MCMLSSDTDVDRRYLKANMKQAKNCCERERNLKEFGVKDILLIEQSDYYSFTLSRLM